MDNHKLKQRTRGEFMPGAVGVGVAFGTTHGDSEQDSRGRAEISLNPNSEVGVGTMRVL